MTALRALLRDYRTLALLLLGCALLAFPAPFLALSKAGPEVAKAEGKLKKRGCTLLVCGLNSQPGSLLFRSGFIDHLGDDNVCPDLSKALERAYVLLPNLMGGSDEDY